MVASPEYLTRHGMPLDPEALAQHNALLYRIPSTGKIMAWPVYRDGQRIELDLKASMVVNTLEPQICFAEQGIGIACIPDIAIREHLRTGRLQHILEDYTPSQTTLSVLWPSSRHLSPKLRVFIDFMAKNLSPL